MAVYKGGGATIGKTQLLIPSGHNDALIEMGGRELQLTNLNKLFWQPGISKRDLLQYYSDISPVLLPHLRNRAMVMKRYPNRAGNGLKRARSCIRRAARSAFR